MLKLKIILLVFLGLLCIYSPSQTLFEELLAKGWDQVTLFKANTAAQASYLSELEKEIVLAINLVRCQPAKFNQIHIRPLEGKYGKSNAYYTGLVDRLSEQIPLPMLETDESLCRIAKSFADSSGKTGYVGHGAFSKRIEEHQCMGLHAENIYYGMGQALEIVIDFLVDENIPSLGHRINLLDPMLRYIGVGIATHQVYGITCVIDFSSCKGSISPR